MEFPTVEKFVKDVGNLVLDDFTYKGKSLREWVDILSKYECLEWIPVKKGTARKGYARMGNNRMGRSYGWGAVE